MRTYWVGPLVVLGVVRFFGELMGAVVVPAVDLVRFAVLGSVVRSLLDSALLGLVLGSAVG